MAEALSGNDLVSPGGEFVEYPARSDAMRRLAADWALAADETLDPETMAVEWRIDRQGPFWRIWFWPWTEWVKYFLWTVLPLLVVHAINPAAVGLFVILAGLVAVFLAAVFLYVLLWRWRGRMMYVMAPDGLRFHYGFRWRRCALDMDKDTIERFELYPDGETVGDAAWLGRIYVPFLPGKTPGEPKEALWALRVHDRSGGATKLSPVQSRWLNEAEWRWVGERLARWAGVRLVRPDGEVLFDPERAAKVASARMAVAETVAMPPVAYRYGGGEFGPPRGLPPPTFKVWEADDEMARRLAAKAAHETGRESDPAAFVMHRQTKVDVRMLVGVGLASWVACVFVAGLVVLYGAGREAEAGDARMYAGWIFAALWGVAGTAALLRAGWVKAASRWWLVFEPQRLRWRRWRWFGMKTRTLDRDRVTGIKHERTSAYESSRKRVSRWRLVVEVEVDSGAAWVLLADEPEAFTGRWLGRVLSDWSGRELREE